MPRRPVFTTAAWLLPGLGQLLIGIIVTALCALACGLTALFRRERLRWLAVPPFLAGLGALLYFLGNLLRNFFH